MNTTVKNKILQKYFFKFFKKYRIKTHRNNITLFHFPQKKIFRKISNNKEGIKKIISEKKLNIDLEVDGGINFENCKIVKEAGANVLVSGSTIFNQNSGNLKKNINLLRSS